MDCITGVNKGFIIEKVFQRQTVLLSIMVSCIFDYNCGRYILVINNKILYRSCKNEVIVSLIPMWNFKILLVVYWPSCAFIPIQHFFFKFYSSLLSNFNLNGSAPTNFSKLPSSIFIANPFPLLHAGTQTDMLKLIGAVFMSCSHWASWLRWYRFWCVFGICLIRISPRTLEYYDRFSWSYSVPPG